MKRLHMYSGLLNATALLLFGLVGIAATLLPRHNQRDTPESTSQMIDFVIPGDLDDRQLADHIQRELAIPLTGPAPNWSFWHDGDQNLHFRLPTPARRYDITVRRREIRCKFARSPSTSGST
ncbi:MAG: hypothetical protein QF768_17930 [Candidatus Latescibacteria bacterium]|nr:hypothetical protein [Candidatus Latescibacterota bacterium]MDP7631536.1 hypothetical protein [Candidatus Latescibacterota bacterium]